MNIAKKLQGGGGSFGALTHAQGRGQTEAAARSDALDATGRVRRSSRAPLAAIVFNPLNPRTTINEESIQELADSLRRHQIVPITVVSRVAFLDAHPGQAAAIGDAEFIALDGNRRLLAATRAGLDTLRVDLNDDLVATASDMLEAALVANAHREDLLPFEEAQAIEQLLTTVYDGNQAAVARALGKSAAWVGQRLALLHLTPELQEQAGTGQLPIEEARKIGAEARAGKLSPAQQKERAQAAKEAAEAKGQAKVSAKAARVAQRQNPQEQAAVNGVYVSSLAAGESADEPSDPGSVNGVYAERPNPAPGTGDAPHDGPNVNGVYPHGVPEPRDPDAHGAPGGILLELSPFDPAGVAQALREALEPRQLRHLVSALLGSRVSPEEVVDALTWQLTAPDLTRVTQLLQEQHTARQGTD